MAMRTISIVFFLIFFKSIVALSNSTFSLSSFGRDSEFDLSFALYGDAKVVDDGDALQLTRSGRVMYKKPVKLIGGKPRRLISFSTDFSFSISPNDGDGLGFIIVPTGLNLSVFDEKQSGLFLGTEKRNFTAIVVNFNTFSDGKNNQMVKIGLGFDVGSVKSDSNNNSNTKWAVITGKKQHAWIDYELGSRRLELRLAQHHEPKPFSPILSYPIDFSQVWEDGKVIIGLTSSNQNSTQNCSIYSWSFKLKSIPNWFHSEPLDPKTITIDKDSSSKPVIIEKEKNCFMKVVAALIFGTGCGALTAFVGLYLWTIFGNRQPVVPEEFAVHKKQTDVVKYKKFGLVLDKAIEDGNKVSV